MKLKKHIAFLLIAAILFNVFPLSVFAAYPYNGKYGRGTYADPVDYIKVYYNELRDLNKISEPTAMFSILDPNKNTLITSSDTAQTLSLFLGDKVTFKDLSTPGSGDNLTKYDFQITHRGALVAQYSTRADVEKVEGFTFNDVGEYNIYLNVMDDTPKEKTDYWGNWSYNGSHKAIGVNPGPTSGSDDDFYGYWYFVEIKVIVSPHTLTETHYDIDTGMELSKTVYNSITSSEYTTYAKTPQQLPGYTYMGSKAGYTWSEAESSIMSASTVTSRKAKYGYINYAENKGSNNAFHWYYYRKLPGLYAAFVIKYSGIDYTDKDLIVQNLPITVNLQDLSVGDKITNWLWEYKTPDMPSFEIFSNIQNPTKELDAEKTYTFRLTVQSAAEQKSIEHYVAVKRGTPVITGEPPTAIITGPSERMAGENITFSGGSSFDPDGTIVSYTWSVPGANVVTNGGKTIKVWYPEPGEYDLFLTVVDNDGMTGECMANIKIIPPIPTAAIDISGKLKENRKVAVSAENSYSPVHYPINKYAWTMTNGMDARYIGSFGSDISKDMILKKAQQYKFDLRVDNTYGLYDTESKSVAIAPDVAPVADFTVATQVLRDPKNSNYATITATNLSKSTDGDTIKKTIMFYAYDSNNDGNFDNETWYYSKDGTTWTATGLTYSQLGSFDLYNLSGASNPGTFTLKTNQVGKYKFECKTIEDILAADTIPSLLTAADYKTGITLTSKPNSAKIVEVINTAPTVSFEVKKKKPIDILIFTDYTGSKLNSLQSVINAKKAQLNAINVDPNFIIVNTSKTIGTQALKKYQYSRYLHFIFKIYDGDATDSWMPSSFPFYKDVGGLWEQTISYEKPLNEMPFGRIYSRYQYINTTTRSGFTEATTLNYRAYDTTGAYDNIGFNSYYNQSGPYYNWTSFSIDSVYTDAQWNQDAYIGTDNLNVTSIDIASIKTATLRAGSDRYAIFLSDGKSKDYSQSFGNNFAFGSLTEDIKTYINQNNFKVYTVADPRAMNTLISKEIGVDVQACDSIVSGYDCSLVWYQTANGYYYFYNTKTNKPYVIDSSTFGDVKSVIYPGFILMKNGTTKFFDGSSFYTVPINNIISVQKLDGYNSFAVVTSSNVYIVDAYNKWSIKATIPTSSFIAAYYGVNNTYAYAVIASSNSVSIVNLNTMTIVNTFAQNNFISLNINYRYSIILADSDSIDVINASNMTLYRTYTIPGGVKQIYPKSGLAAINDATYGSGIYVLNNTGRIYRYKDTNYDDLIDAGSALPAAFSSYNIKSIPDYITSSMGTASFYMLTTDNKLLYYQYDTNAITVKNSNFPVVEESIYGSNIVVRLSNGSVYASYPIVVDQRYSHKKEDYYNIYGQSSFFNVPLPSGVTVKQLINTVWGMFLLDTNNNLYQITYTAVYQGDQSPRVTLYKSGVSSLLNSTDQAIYFTLTNGDIYHRYKYYNYTYVETLTNLKKLAITDSGTDYLLYNDGTERRGIISTNITMTNPSAGYITLNDLASSNLSSVTFAAGQYSQALDYLTTQYTADPSYTTNFILVGDTVDYNVIYQDYENDLKYNEYWTYSHDADYFENSWGTAAFSGKTLNTPVKTFDKPGKYTIGIKVKDNPKNDTGFDNYRLYNQGIVSASLYVHRAGVPVIKTSIVPNGSYFKLEASDGGSYDLDHISMVDKGIVAREWRWKEALDSTWHNGRIVKADCLPTQIYYIQLRVKDVEGVWSDWKTITVKDGNPPVAQFRIDNNPLKVNDLLKLIDQSHVQSFSVLSQWHWIVKKLNSDGNVPGTNIQNEKYANSNAGTGILAGYDTNVKTDYADTGTGIYRIYLRVKDSNGQWSDGGSDSLYNINSFYSQDLTVQESFKLSGFRVTKVRDLKLKSYYYNPATGKYDDKPITVNNMAVDYQNFGGMVDGLSKGYVFEFAIDSVNFNDEADTIKIMPHFYTCDSYRRDPEERTLYWENSRHEVLKAGEGGHAAWNTIELTKNDRIETDVNNATWKGSYLIPGTAWTAPSSTTTETAKENMINRDIIVSFEIKGYKNGVLRYDYNLQQWPLERTIAKHPYEIGDVIRYSYLKSNLEDSDIKINRP